MTRQSVIDRLGAEADGLRRRFGVEGLALFGSVARDEAHEGSDVDLLVTFAGRPDFDHFMGLKLSLEDLFGRRIDLVTPNAIRAQLRRDIEREAIPVL